MRDYRLRNGVSVMRLREENGKMLSMTGNISKYSNQSMTLVCGISTIPSTLSLTERASEFRNYASWDNL